MTIIINLGMAFLGHDSIEKTSDLATSWAKKAQDENLEITAIDKKLKFIFKIDDLDAVKSFLIQQVKNSEFPYIVKKRDKLVALIDRVKGKNERHQKLEIRCLKTHWEKLKDMNEGNGSAQLGLIIDNIDEEELSDQIISLHKVTLHPRQVEKLQRISRKMKANTATILTLLLNRYFSP